MSGQGPPDEMPPLPPDRRIPPIMPRFNTVGSDPLGPPYDVVHEVEPEWLRRHRAAQIIKAIFGVVVLLIGLRFVLLLLGANPDAAFTRMLYGITVPLVFLFREVFPDPQRHGRIFEVASLLAMVVYWLLGRIIARFVYLREPRGHT